MIKIREEMGDRVKKFFNSKITNDKKTISDLLLDYFNSSKQREKSIKTRNKPLLYKFKFHSSMRKEFLNILNKEGYDQAYIFPGYKSIACKVNSLVEQKGKLF